MFPNPQDALPLPQRPDLEQYRKLSKNLARSAKVGEDAIRNWVRQWITELVRQSGLAITPAIVVQIEGWHKRVAKYAIAQLIDSKNTPTLARSQFVIARSQGFESWTKFAKHIKQLAQLKSATSQFEAAAEAIVNGDIPRLQRLLRDNPELVGARSNREHGAALLHYASANGIEGYRQKTPQNIVEIARILLSAGAEVNATCRVYGGDCTTLGLTATSMHPAKAGVMNELLQLMLDEGAYVDKRGSAGRTHSLVFACLANGQLGAARFLASKGAPVDFVSGAALDRLEQVQRYFTAEGGGTPAVAKELMQEAFRYACGYGATRVVEFLLQRGAEIAEHSGDGYTGTHYAAMYGNLETLKLLLRHNPPLEIKTVHGGTVLWHALESAARHRNSSEFSEIIDALLRAGAAIPEKHPPVNRKIDAMLNQCGTRTDLQARWFEE